jgi:shikimate kinase
MVDLDDIVERNAGKSISEIFDDVGESGFRDLESESLFALPTTGPAIISLGGGAILREQNRQWIRRHGICIWLDASPETLVQRILADQTSVTRRPALTDLSAQDEIRRVLSQRRPFYEQVSDCRVLTTGKTIEQVADEVVEFLRSE